MKFQSPFWKQCKASIKTKPYSAGTNANQPVRTNEDLDWLYSKVAYANASAGANGLNVAGWSHLFNSPNGAYQRLAKNQQDEGADSFNDPVFLPKPHIVSAKISGDPSTYGTVRTGAINFKVYSKGQLSGVKDFLTPGKKFKLNIGWDGRRVSTDRAESFEGTIYKFNVSLSPDGGYECYTEAIGDGNNILSNLKVDSTISFSGRAPSRSAGVLATTQTNTPTAQNSRPRVSVSTTGKVTLIQDEAGNELIGNNIFAKFNQIKEDGKGKDAGAQTFLDTYPGVVIIVPRNYTSTEQAPKDNTETDSAGDTKAAFVTVATILQLVNEAIQGKLDASFGGYAFPEAAWYQVPFESSIASSNPLASFIKDNCTYGEWTLTPSGEPAINGGKLDLKNVYISIDWLLKQALANLIDSDSVSKIFYLKIGDFWRKIFDVVNECYGSPYNLTLARNSDSSDNATYIVDINNIDSSVKPVYIDSAGPGNWVRSLSLQSNLPSEVSNIFYVANQAPPDIEKMAGRDQLLLSFLKGTSYSNNKLSEAKDAAEKAKKALGSSIDNGKVSSLAAANKTIVNLTRAGTPAGSAVLAPFELSAVLDGTPGFMYGDVISSNYVPDIYRLGANGVKIGFIVTNVEHNVSNSDWTTTLSTQCKLYK